MNKGLFKTKRRYNYGLICKDYSLTEKQYNKLLPILQKKKHLTLSVLDCYLSVYDKNIYLVYYCYKN